MEEVTLTLSKNDLQNIIDYFVIQHDSLFEVIINNEDDGTCRKDELVMRKFFLQAKEKGINIDNGLYKWDDKILRMDNINEEN